MGNVRYFLLALIFLIPSVTKSEEENNISGTWAGEVSVDGQDITLIFEIDHPANGKLTGTLLVPKQYPQKIPLTLAILNNRDVSFDVSTINGGFTGKLSASGKRISGNWEQGNFALPLKLDLKEDVSKLTSISRPQIPGGTPSYIVEEVTFKNANDGYTLAGTLTRPTNPFRPTPGIILVSGSGPHDRDSTILRHKPFLVLADYLTRKGFSVLRYDDRGVGKSGGDFATATTNDFVKDAEAALDYLKTRKEIDTGKIGIVGHSEGGMIAPLLASEREDVRFIVLMAGPGVKGTETVFSQRQAIASAAGVPEGINKLSFEFLRALFDVVLNENPDQSDLAAIQKKFEAEVKKLSPEEIESLTDIGQLIKGQVDAIRFPWMVNFLKHDPRPVLEKVRCPVLAICGDKDLQVLSKLHLPEIEKHLKAGGNTAYQVRELKGLNHLFQECESGLPGKYGEIEQTISPRVLKGISDWIESVTK